MSRKHQDKLRAEWFWVDRWDASSAALLSMEQQGVYRTMLSQAWLRGARLPNDEQAIQRAIRCSREEWERSWPAVKDYWRVEGQWLVNDTQLEVYLKTKQELDRKHEKAMKAAAASPQVQRKREREVDLMVEPEQSPKDKDQDKDLGKGSGSENGATERSTEHVKAMLEHQREEYAHSVWEAFCEKSGYPATRQPSSNDWYVLKRWLDDDVPAPVVLRAIRESNGTGHTLAYYRKQVDEAYVRWRKSLQVTA